MELNRRTLLGFAGAGVVTFVLPRAVRAWHDYRQAASMLVEPSVVHTYEDGVDAQPVADSGVVKVSGAPVYSAADAVHGERGWLASASAGGGQLVYPNPNVNASSGSVYVNPHTVASAATVVGLKQGVAARSFLAKVRLRPGPDFKVDIVDANNVRLAISKSVWLVDQRMRLDWHQSWDGTNVALTVWVYVNNPEGWRPDMVLTATFPSASAVNVSLAALTTSASIGFDTYREYASAAMPAPYQPAISATAVHNYDEGVDGAAVLADTPPGVDGITGVAANPTYSSAAALHGPRGVLVPAGTGGGTLRYDNPYPPAHTGSLYVRSVRRGASDSRIVTFQNGATVLAQLVISTVGTIRIADAAGTVLAETPVRARVNRWTRIDWQATWDGTDLAVDVRYFVADPESADTYTTASTSTSSPVPAAVTPDTLRVGSSSSGWQIHFDTLRTFGDVTAWPAPFNPAVVHVLSLIGETSPAGALVSSMVFNAATADLALSQAADMSGATFLGAEAADADGLLRHAVSGLTPATQYYAQLAKTDGTLFGDQVAFRTLPEPGQPIDMRIALMSCQQSAGPDLAEPVWQDLLSWDPDLVVHGGDFGYWGGTLIGADGYQSQLSAYQGQFQRLPVMRRALMGRPSLIQVSDHETSGNNGDNYNDPATAAALTAYQKLMPVASYGDTRDSIRGRFLARSLGANMRLISLDFRSLDRSPGAWQDGAIQPDGSTKTALGQAQMDWLYTELKRPETLKILLSDPAWGPATPPPYPVPNSYLDKWCNYQTEQQTIAGWVTNELTDSGTPINVDFWGNDRHLLGYLAGANNPLGGFPVLCGSGIDQHALPLMAGEMYDQMFGANTNKTIPVKHYMRIELHDDGLRFITRKVTGFDTISNTPKVEATDTWEYRGGHVSAPVFTQLVGSP